MPANDGFPNKDVRILAKALIKEGWTVGVGNGAHVRWYAPGCKRCVYTANSPGQGLRTTIKTVRKYAKEVDAPLPDGWGKPYC